MCFSSHKFSTYICAIAELFVNGQNAAEFQISIAQQLILYIRDRHELRIVRIVYKFQKGLLRMAAAVDQQCTSQQYAANKTKTTHSATSSYFSHQIDDDFTAHSAIEKVNLIVYCLDLDELI